MARTGNSQKTKNYKISKKVPPPVFTDRKSKAHEITQDFDAFRGDTSLNVDSPIQRSSSAGTSANNKHTTEATEHLETIGDSNCINARFGNGLVHRLLNHLRVASTEIVTSLKNSFAYLWDLSAEQMETQRPLYVAMKRHFVLACDTLRQKFGHAYPIFLKWCTQFCNLLLLLFIFWIDCAFRGINSFLRMGTSSFFALLWLTLFSAISMIGIPKFSLILIISLLAAVFMSLMLGILIFSLSGIILLWMYGSFWTTMLVITVGAAAFMVNRERASLLITTVYSLYCAWGYVGWFGVVAAMNLSFLSSDMLVLFLKAAVHPSTGEEGNGEDATARETRGPGVASTSGELTSEEEVLRVLGCRDHYEVLGVPRYVDVDTSFLKREYRKKAMLVHPDKNMGNEKAAEAFKTLQNAYEILMDDLKRKAYDDELRKEELLNYFRKIQGKNGVALYNQGSAETRHIACEKCKKFHLWICTQKQKSRARFCQECNDFHQAKDGEGWVEQTSEPLLFGFVQKVNAPRAYVCAESKTYDVTEWFVCQEMRCPANTHKASFQVNTTVMGGKRKKGVKSEELYEWFQNAARSGMFDADAAPSDIPTPPNDSPSPKSASRRKRGKKHS